MKISSIDTSYGQMYTLYINLFLCILISFRCVPDNRRAFAMGLQYVFLKTIGLIPGPIIFGHLLDLCCRLWQNICGHIGRCFVYDVHLVGRNLCVFGSVAMGKDD